MVFGLFSRAFRAEGLLAGWAVGIAGGSWLVVADGLKPVHPIVVGGATYGVYVGLLALAVNIVVAAVVSLAMGGEKQAVRA